MRRADQPLSHTSLYVFLIPLNATPANHSSQIDTEKLAQLAGFANGKSANTSWSVIKKKLMGGATLEGAILAKKPKAKAATNGDADDDDEATPTKAAPKKRGKAIKVESADAEGGGDADEDEEATPVKAAPKKRTKAVKIEAADVEGGDADTEATPAAESPKKGRTKKATGVSNNTEANGDAANNNAATTEVVTTTTTTAPKRKRGPNKPKDPNATPAKRAKKGANNNNNNGAAQNDNEAANGQLHANQNGSIFGGDADVKMEEEDQEEGDDRPLDAEEQKMADDTLFGIYTSGEPAD